jgi:8-oxo-dGTP diphosphatase
MITCKFEDRAEASLRHVIVDALILKGDKILLVKRASRLTEGGKWGLAGGFLDRDEFLIDAVKREILEETGWEVKDIELLEVVDNPNRGNEDRQNVAFVYTCKSVRKVGEADDESDDQQWFDIDKLPADLAFDHMEMIKYYLKNK